MKKLELRPGIRRLFRLAPRRPADADEQADEEIRLHLQLRAEQLRREGRSPEEARAQAERLFGSLDETRPVLHDSARRRDARLRMTERADELRQDLRAAWRGMRRAPAFTALMIATLAIGIGAATAIFSVINGVLLRPLPYPDPDRLVVPYTRVVSFESVGRGYLSYPELLDVATLPAFEQIAAYAPGDETITGGGSSGSDVPERVQALYVTANLFGVLRTPPMLGRSFTPAEDQPGQDKVAMLSYQYWQRRFAADAGIIGRPLVTADGTRTIVGVLPASFTFSDVDLYLPLAIDPAAGSSQRGAHNFRSVARLATEATRMQADAQLAALTTRLRHDYPEVYPSGREFALQAVGMHDAVVGNVRVALRVLAGVVGLVLLIACANAANLLLVRAEGRQRELAVRAALGAGRGRIMRQLLTESMVLALIAGAAGVMLAMWAMRALIAVNPDALPRHENVGLDPTVVVAAIGLSLITGMVFGTLPALRASRTDLHGLLKTGGRTGSMRQRGVLKGSLVVGEIALAMIVVIAAGLLLRSFSALRGVDAGLDPRGMLTMATSLPPSRYPTSARVTQGYEEILARLRAIPGVEDAGAVVLLPIAVTGWNWEIIVEGQVLAPGAAPLTPRPQVVTPGALDAMRIAIARGRDVTMKDDMDAPLVALINETMARTAWPGENPLGKRFRMSSDSIRWTTVVGVVKDVRSEGLRDPATLEFYVPQAQFRRFGGWTLRDMTLIIRTDGDPALLAAPARRALADVDPELAAADVRTMQQVVDRSVAQPRFTMLLLSAFGAVALLLATVGVYGVISHGVAQRTREFGIRVALGAGQRDVVRLVVRQGLMLAIAGVALGVVGALAATRALRSLLFDVSATDPLTYGAIALLLLGVAVLASIVPARRATHVDPTLSLREE
jgi:putative ABC transport system permease protein